jgi:hypothetical protein
MLSGHPHPRTHRLNPSNIISNLEMSGTRGLPMSRTICAAALFKRNDEYHACACLDREGSGDDELLRGLNIGHERQGFICLHRCRIVFSVYSDRCRLLRVVIDMRIHDYSTLPVPALQATSGRNAALHLSNGQCNISKRWRVQNSQSSTSPCRECELSSYRRYVRG